MSDRIWRIEFEEPPGWSNKQAPRWQLSAAQRSFSGSGTRSRQPLYRNLKWVKNRATIGAAPHRYRLFLHDKLVYDTNNKII